MKFEGNIFSRLFFLPFIVLPPLLVWLMTRQGIGLFGDNLIYFEVAESLDVRSMSAHPPLYPVVLGLLMRLLSLTPEAGALLINMICFPATMWMLIRSFDMAWPGRRAWILCGVTMAMLSAPLLQIHAYAFSESLFLATSVTCMLALVHAGRFEPSPRIVLLAATAAALSALTRFAGAALILYGAVVLFFLPGPFWVRMRRSCAYLALSSIPVAVFISTRMIVDSPSGLLPGRTVSSDVLNAGFAGSGDGVFPFFMSTLTEWFIPYRLIESMGLHIAGAVILGIVLLLLFAGVGLSRNMRSVPGIIAGWIIFFVAFHIIWIFASGETHIQLGNRILSPVACWLLPYIVVTAGTLVARWRLLRVPVLLFVALLLGLQMFRAWGYVQRVGSEGVGVYSSVWRESEMLEYVMHQAPPVPLYVNALDQLRLLGVDRDLRGYPRKLDQRTGRPLPHFERDLEAMRRALADEGALVVVFRVAHPTDEDFPPYLVTPGEMMERLDLVIVREFADGVVLGYDLRGQ